MQIERFNVEDLILITPRRFSDDRGYFTETYKREAFNAIVGKDIPLIQDNESLSSAAGTVRGLHFQAPPHAQGKLVRCVAGALIDVAVDVRSGSPTYGQHVRVELSAENGAQLWVPEGFLHGFSTLMPNTVINYKVTDVYAAGCEGSVMWNDPELGIDWGIDGSQAQLSSKDTDAPLFKDFVTPF